MVIKNVTDAILHGVSGDTKPTNYPTNTILLEQDTGSIYRYSGSSWDLFRGASKTEILTNKTIDAADQSDVKRMITADFVRETGWQVPCVTGTATHGWMLGLTFLGASGALQTIDSSDGLSYLFTSATTANTSQAGQKTANPFTYRAWNPYFRLKVKTPSSTNRILFGFSSNTTTPTTDTFLSTTDSGVFIGFRPSTDTNYVVFNNDGAGGAMATTTTSVGWDTGVHSFEIVFDNSIPNCVVKIDGTTVATLTTKIPASGTALMLYFFVEPTTGTARTLQLYNAWYEHKRTATPL